jgi:DeoR/GlpR family transcriptional regulator of sugar metabolism
MNINHKNNYENQHIFASASFVSIASMKRKLINHQTQIYLMYQLQKNGENQHTFSKFASFEGKTTILFDSKPSEALLASIADTEL